MSVITVAAPRGPPLTKDGSKLKNASDLEDLRGKIRLVYRMAGHHGQEYVVLGASINMSTVQSCELTVGVQEQWVAARTSARRVWSQKR